MSDFFESLMRWPTHNHFWPGVILPFVLMLAALHIQRRLGQKNSFGPFFLLTATALTAASGILAARILGMGLNSGGAQTSIHLLPVFLIFVFFQIWRTQNLPTALEIYVGTCSSMLIADIVAASWSGIGIEYVGGNGWSDGLLHVPIFAAVAMKCWTSYESYVYGESN
jgi:hypothetical protein